MILFLNVVIQISNSYSKQIIALLRTSIRVSHIMLLIMAMSRILKMPPYQSNIFQMNPFSEAMIYWLLIRSVVRSFIFVSHPLIRNEIWFLGRKKNRLKKNHKPMNIGERLHLCSWDMNWFPYSFCIPSIDEPSVHATIWNDILYLFWIISVLTIVYTAHKNSLEWK